MSGVPRTDYYESPSDDPENWNNGLYFSARDTRLLVPKRFGFGYTFNFGQREYGFPAFLSITVLPALFIHVYHLRRGRLAR